jgi:hypothetical protein
MLRASCIEPSQALTGFSSVMVSVVVSIQLRNMFV